MRLNSESVRKVPEVDITLEDSDDRKFLACAIGSPEGNKKPLDISINFMIVGK